MTKLLQWVWSHAYMSCTFVYVYVQLILVRVATVGQLHLLLNAVLLPASAFFGQIIGVFNGPLLIMHVIQRGCITHSRDCTGVLRLARNLKTSGPAQFGMVRHGVAWLKLSCERRPNHAVPCWHGYSNRAGPGRHGTVRFSTAV